MSGVASCGKEELNECLIDRYVVANGEVEFGKVRKVRLSPEGIPDLARKNP